MSDILERDPITTDDNEPARKWRNWYKPSHQPGLYPGSTTWDTEQEARDFSRRVLDPRNGPFVGEGSFFYPKPVPEGWAFLMPSILFALQLSEAI